MSSDKVFSGKLLVTSVLHSSWTDTRRTIGHFSLTSVSPWNPHQKATGASRLSMRVCLHHLRTCQVLLCILWRQREGVASYIFQGFLCWVCCSEWYQLQALNSKMFRICVEAIALCNDPLRLCALVFWCVMDDKTQAWFQHNGPLFQSTSKPLCIRPGMWGSQPGYITQTFPQDGEHSWLISGLL